MARNKRSKNSHDSSCSRKIGKRILKEKLKKIINSEQHADIYFIVGREKRKIPAHKLFLSLGSPVFQVNFKKRWRTKNGKEILVPDLEPDAFLALLRFFYTGATKITGDTVMAIWYAAHKYEVTLLENACVGFLKENVHSVNVFTILKQARFFNEADLVNLCEETIDKNSDAFKTDEFTEIDLPTLCSILERDTLRADELDLLQASLRWSEAECHRNGLAINSENKWSVLKDALYLIRFPLMSKEKFLSEVAKTRLLPDEDLVPLLIYFSDPSEPPGPFNKTPRVMPIQILNRFSTVSNSFYSCDGVEKTLVLKADHDLQLLGIGMFCPPKGEANYAVKLTITSMDQVHQLSKHSWECVSSSCNTNETNSIFRLFLTCPANLIRRRRYQLKFSIQGPDSLCGMNGQYETGFELSCQTGEKVKIRFASINGEENTLDRGQLPELIFSW